MQVTVSPEAILQAIEYLKMMCEDQEWSSKEFLLDPENLYRHVGALLADEPVPELVPAKIAEVQALPLSSFRVACAPLGTPIEQMDAMLGPIGSPESFRIAVEWGFIFYRDFFREEPTDGHEDGYLVLTTAAHGLLATRAARVAMHSLPPS